MANQLERCILCGKETDVSIDTPIDRRTGYMEGMGQLCRDCYLDMLSPGRKTQAEDEALLTAVLHMSTDDTMNTSGTAGNLKT